MNIELDRGATDGMRRAGVKIADVRQAIDAPDRMREPDARGRGRLWDSVRRFEPDGGPPFTLLVLCDRKGMKVKVLAVHVVFDSLAARAASNEPHDLYAELAKEVGLDFSVGGHAYRYLQAETVVPLPGETPQSVVDEIRMASKRAEVGGTCRQVGAALVFHNFMALDPDAYDAYVQRARGAEEAP
jgi:hypothetical protein